MTVNTRGVTRFVILTRRYAIKVPRFWHYGRFRWEMFLYGLLGNMQEAKFARTGWPELCPVYFAVPGGWLLVMPRCEALDEELTPEQYAAFTNRPDYVLPVEHKADSFGYLNGHLVAVDYGS